MGIVENLARNGLRDRILREPRRVIANDIGGNETTGVALDFEIIGAATEKHIDPNPRLRLEEKPARSLLQRVFGGVLV